MYEITVRHIHCGMEKIIFGYSIHNAFKRNGMDANLWSVIDMEYVD